MNKQIVLAATAAVLLVSFVLGSRAYRQQHVDQIALLSQANAAMFVPADAQTYGAPDAKVYIVEFFDPACETCKDFAGYVKQIVAAHPGQVQVVLRYAPFHPGSDNVVKMLEATRKQDKYWDTLETMFATQPYWAGHDGAKPDLLWQYLARAGVDVRRLQVDMADPALDALVKRDLADAAALGVRQTPEFFVNGKPLPSWGLPQLQGLVESELKANYGAR